MALESDGETGGVGLEIFPGEVRIAYVLPLAGVELFHETEDEGEVAAEPVHVLQDPAANLALLARDRAGPVGRVGFDPLGHRDQRAIDAPLRLKKLAGIEFPRIIENAFHAPRLYRGAILQAGEDSGQDQADLDAGLQIFVDGAQTRHPAGRRRSRRRIGFSRGVAHGHIPSAGGSGGQGCRD